MFEWILVNYIDGYEDIRESDFPDYPDALYTQGLLAFLLRNQEFRSEFAAYCRLIASPEANNDLMSLYNNAVADAKPLISTHIQRWNGYVVSGCNVQVWQRACTRIKTFIENRPAIFMNHVDRLLSMYEE